MLLKTIFTFRELVKISLELQLVEQGDLLSVYKQAQEGLLDMSDR